MDTKNRREGDICDKGVIVSRFTELRLTEALMQEGT